MLDLKNKKCKPCEGGTKPMHGDNLKMYTKIVHGWTVVDRPYDKVENNIRKEFKFSDFKSALEFVNKIGRVAEEEGHHPDIVLKWGKVVVELWTHAIGGLSENDFILAYKIDSIE